MAGNLTLAIIKPHAHYERNAGKIISRIEEAGFAILLCKMIQLLPDGIAAFYGEHKGKDFYPTLEKAMTNGPSWILVLAKDNAVEEWRKTIGSTNPAEAAEGTIRRDFGDHTFITHNAVHGSADDWEAQREIGFFFAQELKVANAVKEMQSK